MPCTRGGGSQGGGRRRSAERGNGVKQPPTMPDQRDTKILEILGRQARQHSLVDLVIVEGGGIALEAQILQPASTSMR